MRDERSIYCGVSPPCYYVPVSVSCECGSGLARLLFITSNRLCWLRFAVCPVCFYLVNEIGRGRYTKRSQYLSNHMKAIQSNVIAPSAPLTVETIRPADILIRDGLLSIDGDKVTIKRGSDVSPSELALFIQGRTEQARTFGSQARWAFYDAGLLPNGTEVQEEIAKRLRLSLSKSAYSQLTSEARSLCPVIIANGLSTPLSNLKDAIADLKTDEKFKFLPATKQSDIGKKLLPLLKAGEATQVKIREIKGTKNANAPTKPTAPTSGPKAKDDATSEAVAYGNFIHALTDANKYAQANKLGGVDRDKAVNILTDICRALGLSVMAPSAPKAPAPAPAAPAPKPEEKK